VANFTVVYDACVLYPASVRDLIVELARTGLFRAKWTGRIHAEWINAVIRHRPELVRARLERVAELMNSGVPDCLVTGFAGFDPYATVAAGSFRAGKVSRSAAFKRAFCSSGMTILAEGF
jgi:hypothetical protein